MSRRIAFFDFDGTITTKDTLLEFIKFYKGRKRFYSGFLFHLPLLLAYKTGIISNHAAKEKMLRHFFSGEPLALFTTRAEAFVQDCLPALIRPKALTEIHKLKESGATVVIVSASVENWIAPWCNANDLHLIGTKLQVEQDRITGRFDGYNCHGVEKVNRIRAAFNVEAYDEIYGYGDTKGDKPMLGLATFSFYKPFR